jgi:hypothetical protein
MSAPIVYTSADAGAPVVNTLDHRRINDLLYACLVTGYGSKPAAGWTRPYDSGYDSAFRQGGGNQFYIQINGQLVSNPPVSIGVAGYETMTAISTGTGRFPSSGNGVWWHGVGSSGAPRPWVVVADDRTFYLFLDELFTGKYQPLYFGDVYSFKTGDAYRTILVTHLGGSPTWNPGSALHTYIGTTAYSILMARSHDGVVQSSPAAMHGDSSCAVEEGDAGSSMRGPLAYPHQPDGNIWLAPIYVHQPSSFSLRGKMRGLWHWLHHTSGIADRDTFSGTGELAGKTFMLLKYANGPPGSGVFCIETSNTWLTN